MACFYVLFFDFENKCHFLPTNPNKAINKITFLKQINSNLTFDPTAKQRFKSHSVFFPHHNFDLAFRQCAALLSFHPQKPPPPLFVVLDQYIQSTHVEVWILNCCNSKLFFSLTPSTKITV